LLGKLGLNIGDADQQAGALQDAPQRHVLSVENPVGAAEKPISSLGMCLAIGQLFDYRQQVAHAASNSAETGI
jgi:hypothetical protein